MPGDIEPNSGRYLGLGIQVAVGVGLGLLAGRWLDNRYGWTPWGVLVCTALGLASGLYQLIKDGLRVNRD